MKSIRNQLAAEMRQLPGILGKFIGGVTVIFGTLAATLGLKHDVPRSIVLGVIAFCAGAFLFLRSARWLEERKSGANAAQDSSSTWRESALAWGLLACFVALFLLFVQMATTAA